MKKIIILLMNCNKEPFLTQSTIQKVSIQKQIDVNNFTNITYFDYIGSNKTRKNGTTIKVNANDDFDGTYDKTIKCLEYVNKNLEYDYIFRTNTSTFINLALLNEYVNHLNENELYGSEIYNANEAYAPTLSDKYLRGNGILFSKKLVNLLISHKDDYKQYKHAGAYIRGEGGMSGEILDDVAIGAIMNINKVKINSWKHAWYKCVDNYKPMAKNKWCYWNNENLDFNFLNQFITIQVKSYSDKDNSQQQSINDLTNVFVNNKYNNIEKIVNDILTAKPSIFLGYFKPTMYTGLSNFNEIITNSQI